MPLPESILSEIAKLVGPKGAANIARGDITSGPGDLRFHRKGPKKRTLVLTSSTWTNGSLPSSSDYSCVAGVMTAGSGPGHAQVMATDAYVAAVSRPSWSKRRHTVLRTYSSTDQYLMTSTFAITATTRHVVTGVICLLARMTTTCRTWWRRVVTLALEGCHRISMLRSHGDTSLERRHVILQSSLASRWSMSHVSHDESARSQLPSAMELVVAGKAA